MIAALIFAGGTGFRMHTAGIPKQFLKIYGKPIIIYTLEHFQKHHLIDKIIIVSLSTHLNLMADLVSYYRLTKVSSIVVGGNTGQESIWNGLNVIKEFTGDDDIVLIHDGVRPVITEQLISDNIESVRKHGNGISACFAWETICQAENQCVIGHILPRERCLLAKAPQSFKIREIVEAHMKAMSEGLTSAVDSASLMIQYGHTLHYVPCDPSNIKITNPVDFYLFKGMLTAQESMQIIGL